MVCFNLAQKKERRRKGREGRCSEPMRRWGRRGQRLSKSESSHCEWTFGNQSPGSRGAGLRRRLRDGLRQCCREPWGTKWRQRRHWGWPPSQLHRAVLPRTAGTIPWPWQEPSRGGCWHHRGSKVMQASPVILPRSRSTTGGWQVGTRTTDVYSDCKKDHYT